MQFHETEQEEAKINDKALRWVTKKRHFKNYMKNYFVKNCDSQRVY